MALLAPPHSANTTIRFFISSTFSDFKTERDVLQRRVFPELRRVCAASGYRLQPIDLRWGVSEAASNDRQTLRICFDELERCRQLSPDFFLLILLGQRYGSYILPPELPSALVSRLLPHLAPNERQVFEAAYRLDENAAPPEYALLRVEESERADDGQLREMLERAARVAGVSAEELLLFTGSATHREIQMGLLSTQGARWNAGRVGVLCAVRALKGHPNGALADHFVERDEQRIKHVRQLTDAVLERLPKEQVLHYDAAWQDGRGPDFNEDALAQQYMSLLRPKLEAVIAARTAARDALAATGRDAAALANAAFEQERAARVEGRELELSRIRDYLDDKTGAGLPLVVTGAAGSGKSALLAEAAKRAAAAQPDATLITRYIGVTPGARTFRELLNDLRQAIARASGQPEPGTLDSVNELVGAVATLLATLPAPPERPVLLVLDALDQLGAYTQRTDWLPPRLAPHVRVVVSVLANRPELDYLSARFSDSQVLRLAALSRETGRDLLQNLLAVAPARTLTQEQADAVLSAFAIHGLPLYLRLAASEARRWRSFDPPLTRAAALPSTTSEFLQVILAWLEAPERNGRTLVARSLGDLAAARAGLSEGELLELLARDEEVRKAQRALAHDSPPIDEKLPLPVALWARLHAELDPLLIERTVDGVLLYTFYHQQLRAVVEVRYLAGAGGVARYRALADYFAAQPWRLGPDQWNRRKARELVSQLERTGDRAAVEQALSELADELEQAPDAHASDSKQIAVLIAGLHDRINSGGHWRVGQRLYMRELAAQRKCADRAGEAWTLGQLGILASSQGLREEAARYYAQALDIHRAAGNRAGEGVMLGNMGGMAATGGQIEEAARYYEHALAIHRAVGDRASEGHVLRNLGDLATSQDQREQAARYFEQALAIFRAIGNRAGEGGILNSQGLLARRQGHLDDAARYYEQALAIHREVGDRAEEGTTLNNLGTVVNVQGQGEEAARYYEQALAIHRAVGNRAREGSALGNLGDLAYAQGRPEQATRYYEQVLEISRAVGERAREATTLGRLGTLALIQGRREEAERYYQQALLIHRAVRDHAHEATTLGHLGNLAAMEGRPEQAARYYEQALTIVRAVGDHSREGGLLRSMGALARDQGRIQDALHYYQQALAVFEMIGAREEVGTVQGALAELAEQRQKPGWWPFGQRGG